MPTKPKRNGGASKENGQAIRARYRWHLCPPAKNEHGFDHTHWWAKPGEPEEIAALYELARRHPLVGELRRWVETERTKVPKVECLFCPFEGLEKLDTPEGQEKWKPGELSEELRSALRYTAEEMNRRATPDGAEEAQRKSQLLCLTDIGEVSWANLVPEERNSWRESVGRLRGVEGRMEYKKCGCVTEDVGKNIELHRVGNAIGRKAAARLKGERGTETEEEEEPLYWWARKHWSGRIDPKERAEWEELIQAAALEAHREGHVLIAIAPDLTLNEAKNLMEKEYRKHLQRTGRGQERARWKDWLPIIEAFEKAEAEKGGAYSQTFTRYKRIIDGLNFPSKAVESVTTKF